MDWNERRPTEKKRFWTIRNVIKKDSRMIPSRLWKNLDLNIYLHYVTQGGYLLTQWYHQPSIVLILFRSNLPRQPHSFSQRLIQQTVLHLQMLHTKKCLFSTPSYLRLGYLRSWVVVTVVAAHHQQPFLHLYPQNKRWVSWKRIVLQITVLITTSIWKCTGLVTLEEFLIDTKKTDGMFGEYAKV